MKEIVVQKERTNKYYQLLLFNELLVIEGPPIADHYKFKIILLGEPDVGKSAFNKYCSSRFENSLEQLHEKVYGVSFAVKILKNVNIEMSLVVWNFTGQERYKSVQPHYMSGVSGILLLFDLTRFETFKKLPDWLHFIRRHDSGVPIFLIGTKADLFHKKDVTDTGIANFVEANKLQGYFEVSFKTGLNVEITVQKLSELIYRTRIRKESLPTASKFKRRDPDRPMILDEEPVRQKYLLTLRTIFDMSFDEFHTRIKTLEANLKDIQESQDEVKIQTVQEDLDKISKELIEQNKSIQAMLGNPPVPVPTYLSLDLSREWKRRIDKLRYHLFVFKDVFNFTVKIQ